MIRRSQWLLLAVIAALVVTATRLIGVPGGGTDVSDRHYWSLPFTDTHFSYLLHHLFTVIPVALLSFEHRIRYVSKWSAVLRATLVPALLYLAWDVLFTQAGVWAFDHEKVTGPFLLGLPWEEWVWFAAVPFAVIFIYENLVYYIVEDPWKRLDTPLSLLIAGAGLLMAALHTDKVYTFLAFSSAGVITLWDWLAYRGERRTRFYMTFAVSLVPMVLFNGWLTGMLSASPLVSYHPGAFIGWRVVTMPLEDIFFGYGYLFLITRFYQHIVNK